MQIAGAYFDESGSDAGSPVLCVAGYVIEKEACAQLCTDWQKVLDDYSLPFFRMSACAHHTDPFDKISRPDCIEVEKRMIAIIKRSVSCGIAITVDPKDFAQIVPSFPDIGSPYSYCCRLCLTDVKHWINDEAHFDGEMAYFFESGHVRSITPDPEIREIPDLNSLNTE